MKLRSLLAVVLLAATFTLVPASTASADPAGNWSTLESLLESGTDATLTADISAPIFGQLGMGAGDVAVLDLAGHDLVITQTVFGNAISAAGGASLTITDSVGGGTVNAVGGIGGVGISGTTRISDGTVTSSGISGTTTISGGTVTSSGITGTTTISGGTVTSTGGFGNAGISGTTTISGGTVTANGGAGAAGITGTVSISGGTTNATGAASGAGIGGGLFGSGGTVTISGGTVTATGGSTGGAGIGSGFLSGTAGTLTIPATPVSGSATNGGNGTGSIGAPITNPAGAPGLVYDATTSSGPATFSIEFGWAVTFDAAGGSPTPAPQNAFPTVSDPGAPTRDGFTFTGWYGPSGLWNFADPVTSALTLTAGWDQITYDVTFDSAGGSAVPAAIVNHGDPVAQPTDPTRDGYTFAGWNGPGDTPWDFATPITADVTLTAVWDLNTYTVTFDADGGSAVADATVDHGSPVAEPADPTRSGYTFAGWNGPGDTPWDFATPITGPTALTATWNQITIAVSGESIGGGTLEVTVENLVPNTAYDVQLTQTTADGDTVLVTVSGTTDQLGVLVVSMPIPANASGPATIGVLDAANTTVISSPITIAAAPAVVAAAATGDLAHTGSDTSTTLLIGGVLLALGLALTAGSRMIEPIAIRTKE